MDSFDFIQRIEGAGFTVGLKPNGNLAITPASNLNDKQREFIRSHKDELVAALRSSETLLESGQSGNDMAPANDRVQIHVPEYQTASGTRYSFDLDLPRAKLPALARTSLKYMLNDGQGGGSLLGSPGATEGQLRDVLGRKYGDRLESINGKPL